MGPRDHIPVMTTPLVMHLTGGKVLPVVMHAGKIRSILEDHPGMTPELLKQIPRALADPVAVFASKSSREKQGRRTGLVVMFDLKDRNGATVLGAMHLDVEDQTGVAKVNRLASSYGKDRKKSPSASGLPGNLVPPGGNRRENRGSSEEIVPHDHWFINEAKRGRLLYLNTRKAAEWSQQTGLELVPGLSHQPRVPTEKDLAALREQVLARTGRAFYQDEAGSSMPPLAEERLDRDEQAWEKVVDRFSEDGTQGATGTIPVMTTPLVLHLVGAEVLPVRMRPDVLHKILVGKHHLPPELLKQVPRALADPVAVFRSATHPDATVVAMLELRDSAGSTLVVSTRLGKAEGTYEVNEMTSVYGKDWDGWFAEQLRKGRVLYLDKKKSSLWTALDGSRLLPLEGAKRSFEENVAPEEAFVQGGREDPVRIPDETDLAALRERLAGYYQDQGSPRGSIEFGDGETIIRLFRGADPSTLLHETGHLFLRQFEEAAAAGKLPQEEMASWRGMLSWLGAQEGKPLTREQHEQFARGFEAYVMEGKAPLYSVI